MKKFTRLQIRVGVATTLGLSRLILSLRTITDWPLISVMHCDEAKT